MRLNLLNYIKRLIFPNRCPFCDEVISFSECLCKSCNDELDYIDKGICAACGKEKCECHSFGFYYKKAIVPLEYTRKTVKAIKRFKFNDCPNYAQNFAKIMTEYITFDGTDRKIDIVCGVPMTKRDMKKRGYNQSFLISKHIANLIGKACANDALIKIKSTKHQHTLNARLRRTNLNGAFKVNNKDKIKGKSILLVDDVITTSSTVNECAKTLILSGADKVYVTAVCKAKWLRADKESKKR